MVLRGLAHVGVCVPDVDAAVEWYRDVLGMSVLSPPYLMKGPGIERDMGELIPGVSLRAAIVGFGAGDQVLELIEYPEHPGAQAARRLVDRGISHIGLLCDDIETTRTELEGRGVTFLTSGVAGIAGLRTTWCEDPFGTILILMEKGDTGRPYWRQPAPSGPS